MSARTNTPRKASQVGLSLIELLVAMAIGLVVVLAVSTVLLRFEGDKRTMTSANDLNQGGAYLAYVLDRSLRSAGSGFGFTPRAAFGCNLNVSRSNSAVLPSPAAFPEPFNTVSTTVALAPVLVHKGPVPGSDVIAVMSGSHGTIDAPQRVLPGSIAAGQVRVSNTIGWRNNDLALVVESGRGCLLQQVGSSTFTPSANQVLPLSGTYASNNGTNVSLSSYTGNQTYIAALGNLDNNRPEFLLYGVGDNNTLFSYDMLRFDGAATAPTPVMEGVVEVRAVYGLDTNADGQLDAWADPGSSPWRAADLLEDGSNGASARLRQIVVVRVGMILRTAVQEKDEVAQPSITLFQDLPTAVQQTRDIDALGERRFRHRSIEFTVPLRNTLTSRGSSL
jgi:type IV pilus assembly protein PilW